MDDEFAPSFSPKFRTNVYVSGVVVGFLSFVTAGAAAVTMDDPTAVITIAGLIGTGWGTVSAAFGVAYRPTRQP